MLEELVVLTGVLVLSACGRVAVAGTRSVVKGDTVTVVTNNMITYDFVQITPNELADGLPGPVDEPLSPGTVFGYMFDGYEVVSPVICADDACTDTTVVTSGYERTGEGDLDQCNGMTGADGVNRYHATDEFPYLPFCYHGETEAAAGVFDGIPPAGGPGR